jgi:Phage tail assembly chaperone
MSQIVKKNLQQFSVTILGANLTFNVGREDYNKYINSITQKEKVAPSHNFLINTIAQENADQLNAILSENPGSEVQIAADILEAYTPDLGIVVKKSSAALMH